MRGEEAEKNWREFIDMQQQNSRGEVELMSQRTLKQRFSKRMTAKQSCKMPYIFLTGKSQKIPRG